MIAGAPSASSPTHAPSVATSPSVSPCPPQPSRRALTTETAMSARPASTPGTRPAVKSWPIEVPVATP